MNEQEKQDKFLKLIKSRAKAERLQRIWQNSYPKPKFGWNKEKTKEEVFKEKAKAEKFSDKVIKAFLEL